MKFLFIDVYLQKYMFWYMFEAFFYYPNSCLQLRVSHGGIAVPGRINRLQKDSSGPPADHRGTTAGLPAKVSCLVPGDPKTLKNK